MDFAAVCRTCLREDDLNQIFLNSEDRTRFSDAIFITTGVRVHPDDGLPQNMCTNCLDFLNKSLTFRKNCTEVEKKLLNYKNELANHKNDISFKENTATIFVKIEPLSKNRTNDAGQVKMEYLEYEVLEDFDDANDEKPIKYFTDTDTEKNLENDLVFPKDLIKREIKSEDVQAIEPPYLTKPDSENNKRKRVTCKFCQKDLSIRSVNSHMARSHPGADQRKEKCELCDNYVTREKMKRHVKIVHGNEQTLRCGYCKSEYDSKEILIQHVTTCTAKKKRRIIRTSRKLIECDICHKSMQQGSLRLHKAVKHGGLGPVCEHCGRRFSNKLRLSEHYRAKHGYDKFKCDLCDFQSASDAAMQNHTRRHRGEKPYICARCGASFHAGYLLAQHRRSHATDRHIQCKLCPAKFKAPNSLHMHKLHCHSGAAFRCSLCPKTYGSRQYAVKHIRHTHKYTGVIPELQRVDAEPTAGKEGS